LTKAIADLSQSIKSIQDELMMLKKGGLTQSRIDLQILLFGLQYSSTVTSNNPPPNKKLKSGDEEDVT